MVDGRQLDSLVIIWIIEPTIPAAPDMQFKLMRLQSAEKKVVENSLVVKRASARCKAPPSILSSLSSPLSSVASPCLPVVESLSSAKGPNLSVQSTSVAEVVNSQRLSSPMNSPDLSHKSDQSLQFAHSTPELVLLSEPTVEVERPCSPPRLEFAPANATTDCSEILGYASTGSTYIQGQHPMTQAYEVVHADSTSPYHPNVHYNLEYRQTSITPIQTSGMEYLVDSTPPAPSPPFPMTNYQNSHSSATPVHYPLQPDHHHRQVQQQAPVVLSHHAPVLGSDSTMSYPYATPGHQPITQYDHQYQWVAAEQPMYAPRHIANGMSMTGTVDTAGQYTVKPSALSGVMINEEVNRPHLTLEVDNMHGWYSSGPSPVSAGVESALSASSYSGPRRFSESSTWFVEPHLVRRASAPALYYPNSASGPFLSSQYPYSSRQGSQYNVTHEAFVHDYEATYPYRGTDYGVPTAGHMQSHPYQGSNLNVDSSAYGVYH